MKTEVYSWRMPPELKAALEEAAREENLSIARLLDSLVAEALEARAAEGGSAAATREKKIGAALEQCLGTIHGGQPNRSERVREELRDKLKRKHAHSGTD